MANAKVIIKNDLSMGMASVKCIIKSPSQLVSGPGKIGMKLPIMPRNIISAAIIIKIISIKMFKLYILFRLKIMPNVTIQLTNLCLSISLSNYL